MARPTRIGVIALAALTFGLLYAGAASAGGGDSALATQGLVIASDFPSSWNGSEPYKSAEEKALAAAAATAGCEKYLVFAKANDKATKAGSNEYSGGGSVENSSFVYPKAKAAIAAMKAFTDPSTAGCLTNVTQSVERERRANLTSTATVEGGGSGPAAYGGDESFGYREDMTISYPSGSEPDLETIDIVAVRVGRVISVYTTHATAGFEGEPPDRGVLDSAIKASVVRLANAPQGKTAGTKTTATTKAAGGAAASGPAINLTIAASGSIPETKITGTKSPSFCDVRSATDLDISIEPGEVTGMASGDFLAFSRGITKVILGGQFGAGPGVSERAGSVAVTNGPSGQQIVTFTNFPVNFGSDPSSTETTISGTVTCGKR